MVVDLVSRFASRLGLKVLVMQLDPRRVWG